MASRSDDRTHNTQWLAEWSTRISGWMIADNLTNRTQRPSGTSRIPPRCSRKRRFEENSFWHVISRFDRRNVVTTVSTHQRQQCRCAELLECILSSIFISNNLLSRRVQRPSAVKASAASGQEEFCALFLEANLKVAVTQDSLAAGFDFGFTWFPDGLLNGFQIGSEFPRAYWA